MVEILINDNTRINGKASISRVDEGGEIVITGLLSTEKYIEEIITIETERLRILGVQVMAESFGTDSNEIVYSFKADSLDIKDEEKEEEDGRE